MTFYFFDAADKILFTRNDAEQAEHNHQEMSFDALFPYDAGKVITHGQRVGYYDTLGVFQTFEIIKVKTYEPDHYQEITAEHIVISELTDELYTAGDLLNKTPAEAVTALLDGTLWELGNVTATNVSSASYSYGDVWGDLRTVEQNWNVYISPRVTIDSTGIIGRYIDVRPAEGIFRGLRLALEKNLEDASVTWDTSRLKTALYGYGKKSMDVTGETEKQPWTFASVEWTQTADHPAKPSGQIYIEDTAATAAYGRNGRARFGFYQNGDVEDPEKLLELTWETLKTVSTPDVTIEGAVRDLTKFGFVDVPIRLHDNAIIEITPIGTLLTREIVQYNEDLLQPENSHVTIGKYIPNIVYITKEIAQTGGGGGGSGGDTELENKIKEFETEIGWNDYQIGLKAWQRDLEKTDKNLLLAYAALGISASQIQSVVTSSGVQLDANNNIVTDADGYPVFVAQNSAQTWSNITQNANRIALVVTQSSGTDVVNSASIVAAINGSGSTVTINADKIVMNGQTIVTEIQGVEADFTDLVSGTTLCTSLYTQAMRITGDFTLANTTGSWHTIQLGNVQSKTMLASGAVGGSVDFDHSHAITLSESGGVVTATLGAAVTTSDTGRIANFNIAATAFYLNGIAVGSPVWNNASTQDETNSFTVSSGGGGSTTQNTSLTSTAWSGGSRYVNFNAGGTRRMRLTISMPATADSWNYDSQTNTVTCTVGGKPYSTTI